jgi:hypothetical protein
MDALDALPEIQRECYATSAAHGFHDTDTPDPSRAVGRLQQAQRLMLIVSEAAEAFEHLRNLRPGEPIDQIIYDGLKPDGVPIEMADIVIRVMDFCETYNINLAKMMRIKMRYNESRPYKHGRQF